MKLGSILLTVLLSAAVSFGVVTYLRPAAQGEAKKETAFERVMRTNTLRCGYYVFPPVVMRDPNTGAMSGMSIDMMNIIAEKTGLKVEWTEESTFGNWINALQTNRYDVMCAPMWSDMAFGREVIFTQPMYYAAIIPLVRADDTRFDGPDAMEKFNSPDVTFLGQEGNMISYLTKETFPKAKILAVPATVDGPTAVQNIITKKADAILLDYNGLIEYNRNNPVKLKAIKLPRPLKAQPFVMPLQRDETALRDFMSNAVQDLILSGSMDRLLDKWESEPGKIFIRTPLPGTTN